MAGNGGKGAYVAGGLFDVARTVGSAVLVQQLFPTQFPFLMLNVDVLSAVVGLFGPWGIAFAKMTRKVVPPVFRRFEAEIFGLSLVFAALYVFTSISVYYIAGEAIRGSHVGFFMLRALSIFFLLRLNLNVVALMSLGQGARSLGIQVTAMLVSWAAYALAHVFFAKNNVAILGVFLLVADVLLAILSRSARFSRNSAVTRIKKYFYFSAKIKKILIPEIAASVVISLSILLFTSSAFSVSPESYEKFRIPFAFSTALWYVVYRCTFFILSDRGHPGSNIWSWASGESAKASWFVPFILGLAAAIVGGELLLQNLVAVGFYPIVLLVVSGSGALRLMNGHNQIALINLKMFFIFYVPCAVALYFGAVVPQHFVWLIGASYFFRLFLILICLGKVERTWREACRTS